MSIVQTAAKGSLEQEYDPQPPDTIEGPSPWCCERAGVDCLNVYSRAPVCLTPIPVVQVRERVTH